MLSQLSYVSIELLYFVTNFHKEIDDLLAHQRNTYYNRNSNKIARKKSTDFRNFRHYHSG